MININRDIILYTTGCPRCEVLKKKLKEKNIIYTENNSIDDMILLGINEAPVLCIDGKLNNFMAAITWVNQQ